ncbi:MULTISPECIES: hypothetical protein [unclassified Streptomyces]|uniref:hypothetical protein n=1 Tax=unclassified Streptomyces TaxID=2593676 RepID=UPI003436AD15
MGTPSAMPSGPGAWVRGPKNPRQTSPEARPAAPGAEGTGPAPAPQTPAPAATAAPATPAAAAPATPAATVQAAPTPGVGSAPASGHAQVPAGQQAFSAAGPAQAAAPRPKAVPARSAPGRRTAQAPAQEPSWGRPKRPRAARGTSREEIGWVKAHGGSGATSLAEVFGGVEVGARWPDPSRGEPRRVVLVGRTSARGLRSVSQALGALKDGDAPQGLELLGVVLVADAPGRLPLGLLRRIRVLRSVARVHRVPWIPAWRTGGHPKSVPRQLATLAALVGADLYGEGAVS